LTFRLYQISTRKHSTIFLSIIIAHYFSNAQNFISAQLATWYHFAFKR